jgi:hypothetical protein
VRAAAVPARVRSRMISRSNGECSEKMKLEAPSGRRCVDLLGQGSEVDLTVLETLDQLNRVLEPAS